MGGGGGGGRVQCFASVGGWHPARSRFGRYFAMHASHALTLAVPSTPQSACNRLSHRPPGKGIAGTGGVVKCMGQSVRGVSRVSSSWKDPAHASRLVKNPGSGPSAHGLARLRLKRFVMVAEKLECSNCEVLVGPFGSWNTAPFSTLAVTRSRRIDTKPTSLVRPDSDVHDGYQQLQHFAFLGAVRTMGR